ncbi:hypothetical protein [Halotia branconii]|uniref:Uncharacterized protein n=1 Tax=Halotia branconii CENA392 TaxID=1539056 RepID=A0AAJ6NWR9_9CYAN|nr:hypothetical protein [Halotia branconii]WGV28037.1 hypothetical protein QI031_11385 [Halotia branconii CENA392]
MKNQQVAPVLAKPGHIELLQTDELAIIRHRRDVKRLKIRQTLTERTLKIIAITSILSSIFLGIGALTCWRFEISADAIATTNNKQDWQTRKHICFGWMLFAFSSFVGTTSLSSNREQKIPNRF